MNTYKEDIYYIVKVREDIFDPLFDKTTVHRTFCGKLVNQNNGRFYFELNGSDALVIIPHNWIDWMAPSKILWDLRRKAMNNTNKEACWKGAGMGDYYCSLCCEVGDIRSQRCPNCNALMYTDEEYAVKLAEWEAEDEAERAFWSLEGVV